MKEATQADGTTAKVLVPQLYACVRDGDLDSSGALIAGNDVQLATAGDITTSQARTYFGRIERLCGGRLARWRGEASHPLALATLLANVLICGQAAGFASLLVR